jgi:hypothetical protein
MIRLLVDKTLGSEQEDREDSFTGSEHRRCKRPYTAAPNRTSL